LRNADASAPPPATSIAVTVAPSTIVGALGAGQVHSEEEACAPKQQTSA